MSSISRCSIKDFFTNVEAMLFLAFGIAITALAVGFSIYLSLSSRLSSVLAILIAAAGSFCGALLIAGAFRRFTPAMYCNDKLELDKAKSQLEDKEKEIRELQEENKHLNHRLETFINITKIQPALKLVTGEISFDITDFLEKTIKDNEPTRNPITRNFHQIRELYRGVYKYSGTLHLAANLEKVNVYETPTAITIYGPFDYTPMLGTDYKEKWLLHGRREKVLLAGDCENSMREKEIKVTSVLDYDNEESQRTLVRERLQNLDMVNSMKIYTDKIIIEFLKLMLHPTGKEIIFEDQVPDRLPVGLKLKNLQEFIEEYNKEIDKRSSAGFIQSSN